MHRSMVAVNADASLAAFDMVQGTMGSVSTSTPFATIACKLQIDSVEKPFRLIQYLFN